MRMCNIPCLNFDPTERVNVITDARASSRNKNFLIQLIIVN